MNKKLLILIIVVILVLLAFIFISTEPKEADYSLEKARNIAESWIKTSASTYVFDGYGLEFISEKEISEDSFEFLFYFETKAAGYGDRADQMIAQVITPREILVVIKKNEVIKAITDRVYDELKTEMLNSETETITIKLYFGKYGEDTNVFEVEREIEKREDIAKATLEELLKGPIEQGYFTSIPEGVKVQKISIEEGIARVDFSSELNEVAGSARVLAIREQIEKTLLQFSTIEQVIISIDDKIEDILQP
ncbi:MAG: GerMN domain-containing protein [Candidatus Pacebacteria bacterium]|nr:GerMN domain-containing protein [Candidatus Paceibacterota bacterium]